METMRSASSLELTLDHETLKKRLADCTAALTKAVDEKPDCVGFVFAINGRLNSGETYASHGLFR